ncbi:MAG: hypothetical protein WD096_02570 [Actinomycetota bacterium]
MTDARQPNPQELLDEVKSLRAVAAALAAEARRQTGLFWATAFLSGAALIVSIVVLVKA